MMGASHESHESHERPAGETWMDLWVGKMAIGSSDGFDGLLMETKTEMLGWRRWDGELVDSRLVLTTLPTSQPAIRDNTGQYGTIVQL